MSDKNWINEYIKLLFPVNGSDIDISKAQALKRKNTPSKLYKYCSFKTHTINSLKNSSFYLCKAANLNDPFECAVNVIANNYFFQSLQQKVCDYFLENRIFTPEKIKQLQYASEDEFYSYVVSQSEQLTPYGMDAVKFLKEITVQSRFSINERASNTNLNSIFIGSLSENNDNSIMWSHYANEHKGICIEYNLANFDPAPHSSWYMLNPVIYTNDIPDFSKYYFNTKDFNNLIATYAAMIKAKSWEYEQEWRLILPIGLTKKDGILIKFPMPTAIYVGCRASQSDISSLKDAVGILNIPIFQMKRNDNSFLLSVGEQIRNFQ